MHISDIKKRFREIFSSYHNIEVSDHVKKMILMDQYLPLDSTFFTIVDSQTNSFKYVSKNFKACTGYSRDEMFDKGLPFIWDKYHPEDVPLYLKSLDNLMTFTLANTKMKDRKDINYTWNCRLKLSSGEYANLILNASTLELDDKGKPIVGLINYTVLDGKIDMDICISAKIFNEAREYESIYFKNLSNVNLLSNLTKRELDIIRQLILDKSSVEISDIIGITRNTVDTHRRNILSKLGLKSTNELCAYFKKYPNLI